MQAAGRDETPRQDRSRVERHRALVGRGSGGDTVPIWAPVETRHRARIGRGPSDTAPW
jgi:hypothetical protein